jgi:hypothetical protein
MAPYITAGQHFDLAIQVEQAAETLCRRLMLDFPAKFGGASIRRSRHVGPEAQHTALGATQT